MKILLSTLLLGTVLNLVAQREHKDYTSRLKDPTFLKCKFEYPGGIEIAGLISNYREQYKFYGSKKGKLSVILSTEGKTSLDAEDILAYEVTLRNKKTLRFLSIGGKIVKVRVRGERVKLFEREEMVINTFGIPDHALMVSNNVRKKFYVRKKYEAFLTDVDDISEKESLTDYFKECPSVAKQIQQSRLKARSIVSIVQKYNICENFNGED